MSDFTPADLPRVSERIPYLYLEQCVIKRANNALVAADENGETALPIATIAVLMLGPGTTITHDAVVLASDTGAIIVWAGEQGPPLLQRFRTHRLHQTVGTAGQTRIQRTIPPHGRPTNVRDAIPRRRSVPYDDAPTARLGRHPSRSPVHG